MSQPASSSPAKSNALGWMAAVSLLLLALLLRIWGITQESAWWDEYSSLMHLNRGSLFEFLSYNRTLDPATLPLYYAIEYLWSRLAGAGTFDLRIPSLLMGLALIPAVFALGRRCFNPAAGWVAALCVALSPIHIFHAQGIRMYVLFTLLAALSMLAYVSLRDGAGKRWWAIHLLVQFLLSWTHPFALLLPLVQGVAWLPRAARGDWRRLLLWSTLVLLCWLPVLAYLATVEYWPEDSTASWFPAPTLTGVLADLFADDVISATYQLRVSAGAWEWLPVLGPLLLSARPAFDLALAAALLAAFVLAAVACFRAPRFLPSPRRDHLALLLLWVVLPVLVLYIGSLVLRPMIFPRYTVHASLALYLLAGALIGALPQAASRYLATAVLAALFAYQIVLTHPGPQRANYASVADAIDHAASSRTDIVLVRGELWRDVFAYNAQPLDIPIISAEDDSLCALAASHYLGAAPEAATVWLVAPDDYFDSQPESDLESALKAEGLTCEPARYFGIRDLYLYTVRGKGSVAPRPALVKLAQQQSDAEEKRTLLRTIAGTAASLAARGKSTDAYTLLRAYVGDAVDDDFLYGALAHTLREGIGEDDAYATSSSRPGGAAAAPPLSTFDTAMAVTESLGLLQQGHTALAASQLLVLAASSHAPAILTTELLDLAAAFPDDADRYISAAFAVAHPPKDLHYIGIQKAAEHPALASRHIDHVVKTPNPPHDLFFMFMQASVDYPALAETYVDGALAVPNPPENLYYHLIQAATSAAARVGCGPVLTKLLGAARPLAPLDFQISWSTLERRCKEGKDLREFLERKPRMDEGMAAFGEGRLDDARALLQQAMTEDFGMPRLMLAIIALMQGNRAEFDTAAPAALAADSDVDAVFGPVIRALVARDRAAAIQAAEAFRGTDLDNADILLGIINTALPADISTP